MTATTALTELTPGTRLVVGGNRVVVVDAALAAKFRPGDSLVFAERTFELLHIPATEATIAREAVTRASDAFARMRSVSDEQIGRFFEVFAKRLLSDGIWSEIEQVNAEDVERARSRGRSTTRLATSPAMRTSMVEGLRGWAQLASPRGRVFETVDHGSWKAELVGAELGVVAFIFEGRPNVVADATGVLRSGNTVVFRIGRDALGTAEALLRLACQPALREAGLPFELVRASTKTHKLDDGTDY